MQKIEDKEFQCGTVMCFYAMTRSADAFMTMFVNAGMKWSD